ncbi:iron donor protein CyaY [Neiella marina]|uniref:Iron-sulfur cluster assembly protein CyaY n=1 Tax=Neiella holothuriorum TaxID=2870530 RepID=A0ABS7EDF9_9GAMM|nr:iron donor protein CyaY [Neiella holothuriorum]MBW8189953.1 iron donor protein CyaY [Neiella holothuriorum]
MNDTEFHTLIDDQLNSIEEQLDECDADIDYEVAAGILTIDFANGSKIIINRQEPVHQLWLATRTNGYHFDYVDGHWCDDRTGQRFLEILNKACCDQSGETIVIN